eukprot:CAMPEP_0206490438 /NCGR_PEP_ID=MMETSP0324_2-20121206/44098_1 /ASSEMBLY_ACC=CAM_ASM_000836 /TAXON_ID=2866 /ORGANISM="Crypthecodinium cohnii, Strain Seligo" /LENGTH=76 /DNA_ID=CAMNT_0053970833 /DNA_START=33 /DNA_END=260 /DNA_ORIENTATION=-
MRHASEWWIMPVWCAIASCDKLRKRQIVIMSSAQNAAGKPSKCLQSAFGFCPYGPDRGPNSGKAGDNVPQSKKYSD